MGPRSRLHIQHPSLVPTAGNGTGFGTVGGLKNFRPKGCRKAEGIRLLCSKSRGRPDLSSLVAVVDDMLEEPTDKANSIF